MEDTSQILVSTYSGDQAENKKAKILTKKTARLILKGIGIALILIWTLLPIYWMCSLAIRSNAELGSSLGFLPKSFTMAHFTELIIKNRFFMSIKNSLIVSVVALVISMVTGISCSYVFSRVRYRYRLKGLELFIVLLIRILPPIAFALPLYIMMNRIGILSTRLPVILTNCLINIPFIIWFMLSFFEKISTEIEESAQVDGANNLQIFTYVVFPQILPGMAAIGILSFMNSWNEYLYSVIFVQNPNQFTVPLTLATLNSEQELTQWGNVAAGGILSLLPILIFVIFMQRFMIEGLSGGALKE